MAVARFKIRGKLYTSAAMEEISLRDSLLFEQQTLEAGIPMKWFEVLDDIRQVAEQTAATEMARHPMFLKLVAITVWASQRLAGEPVTFGDAIDVKWSELEFLAAEEDQPDPAVPTRARAATRKGSGRATGSRAGSKAAASRGRTTSSTKSGNASSS